jgi:hypothetical protein
VDLARADWVQVTATADHRQDSGWSPPHCFSVVVGVETPQLPAHVRDASRSTEDSGAVGHDLLNFTRR